MANLIIAWLEQGGIIISPSEGVVIKLALAPKGEGWLSRTVAPRILLLTAMH